MSLLSSSDNKAAYAVFHDAILEKRVHSPFAIRRYAHHSQYQAFVDLVPSGSTVLDAGAGEGVLSVLLAKKGCKVLGVDLSQPNVESARAYAEQEGVSDRVSFTQGDAEHLPAEDASYDYVVSSHVLEHLPDFQRGARELRRVAKKGVIAAIPTCLNPASAVLLGGDNYWCISRSTPYAWFVGSVRILLALLTGAEGVDEGYAGRPELIHIHRFPWKGAARLEAAGLRVQAYRASSYPIPYFAFLVPFSRWLLRYAHLPILRTLGYGTTYICTPDGQVSEHLPPSFSRQ